MSDEAATPAADDEAATPVVLFVGPGPDTEVAAALAEALSCEVQSLDPLSLDLSKLCEEASAVVLPWETAGFAGLDLLESLRRGHDYRAPILMSAGELTRERVATALDSSASGLVALPYEADELGRRLGGLLRPGD